MAAGNESSSRAIIVERYEAKYVISPSIVPGIREFIRPFCFPDSNATGDPPEYIITTLQLDTPDLCLHHAKQNEWTARFKLRARIYGLDNDTPVFVEIKRKIKATIVKSRARIPRDKWCADLILDPTRIVDIEFKSSAEEVAFLEFLRLTREISARPKVLIRYVREAYVSSVDQYARVSVDRNLQYQRTDSWDSWGRDGRWRQIDSSLTQNKAQPFSGVVLELKTLSDVPQWIVELVEKFDLVSTGHCKYSNAIWEESLFCGTTESPAYATDLLVY